MKLCECGCGQPAAIAKWTDRSRGYVKGQPTRFAQGHVPGRRAARPASKPGFKVCVNCDTEKPKSDFPRDPQRPSRLYSYCKPCKAARMRAAQKRFRERHPELLRRRQREQYLRKTYGMTLEEYEQLLESQGGCCAICGCSEPPLPAGSQSSGLTFAIDHDHRTGAIRGLLCSPCNLGIGSLSDDPERVRRAAAYLEAAQAAENETRDGPDLADVIPLKRRASGPRRRAA